MTVPTKKARRRAIVIGAGISGLAAAQALRERNYDTHVLESCPSIGGLTRTVKIGDFCFDYTGHLLHLSRYGSPSGIPYAQLCDKDWQRIDRRSYCFVGARLITAPIQYHLAELPPDMLRACRVSYEARPNAASASDATFRDFIVNGFGAHLADVFLIPQNEKTMATPLDRLSQRAVKRFFPPPDDRLVLTGMTSGAPSPPGYNSQFWYPERGGIDLLVEGLARGLDDCVWTLEEVVAVDLKARTVATRTGRRWTWDVLLPSMPLRKLCEATGDRDLCEWARELTHSATICINLGLRGALPDRLRDAHWIYVPDRSIPFYRVGVYSNMSPGTCPPNCSSLYVELGVPAETLASTNLATDLVPRALASLEGLGWVSGEAVMCSVVHVIRCAYVHHTPARELVFGNIVNRLAEHGVFPIGRYGLWDYISMEDSIHSAISTVQEKAP